LKILVLDEEFPWPLNTGKRIRSYNLAAALAAQHHVSYLAYGGNDSPAFRALADARLHPVAVPEPDRRKHGARFYLRLLLNLASPYPYIVTSHRSAAFRAAVNRLVTAGGFDLVICEWTPYAIFVRDFHRPKRVLVAHNIESHIWQRYEEHETNPLRRWYIARQRAKVQAFEKAAFAWVDGATAVSEADAAEIRALGGPGPVAVVDNGVDIGYFEPQGGVEDPHKLVFTGSMDWRPNQDAAHWFVGEIWPRLRAARPALSCTFVGRDPPADVVELGRVPGITITGTVPDVRPMIDAAAAYIVPLRIGGGSRLKILEALAMRKAVISTRVGAEGLRLDDGRHMLLADHPGEFAAAVLRVLDDAALRRRLGEAGRAHVVEHYRWESIGARYVEFLQQVLAT
jgi:sugar transferase (PEP-CTERM/EpsH1 system associated)